MAFARIFSKPSAMRRFQMALEEIDLDLLNRFKSVRLFLKGHIRDEASNPESCKVIGQLISDGLNPKTTAYLFMRVLLEDLLLDGHYHVVTGKLNRDGESYFALYNNVVRELRTLDWFSAEQANAHFREIKAGIENTVPAHQPLKSSA